MINILLTAAGFTSNFGAPLARKIYENLFNNPFIQQDDDLKVSFLDDKNLKNSNYEEIFQELIDNESAYKTDKKEMIKALFEVFKNNVDYYCRAENWENLSYNNKQVKEIEKLLIQFMHCDDRSIFFTLNQDLFIERQFYGIFDYEFKKENTHIEKLKSDYSIQKDKTITLKRLGVCDDNISPHNNEYSDKFNIKIKDNYIKKVKNEYRDWELGKNNYCLYVKLHGSMDFVDEENLPIIITGTNKNTALKSNNLTSEYYEILKYISASRECCNLIIIGYGFCDPHINEEISNILQNDCKLYIADKNKDSLQGFFNKLKENNKIDIQKIKRCIKRYWGNGLDLKCLQDINQIFAHQRKINS